MSDPCMNDGPDTSSGRSRGQAALEKLSSEIAKIKVLQKKFTLQVLGMNALIYLIIFALMRFDVSRTNNVFTNLFQYQAVAWCCWFMLPYFLRVEAKQDAGIAMAHDSVDLMAKMDKAIEDRVERFDAMMGRIEKLVEGAEKGEHPFLLDLRASADRIHGEVKRVADSMERPITPVVRKPVALPEPVGSSYGGNNGEGSD